MPYFVLFMPYRCCLVLIVRYLISTDTGNAEDGA